MIIGIGVDIIETERFKAYHLLEHKRLSRIFSTEEIIYCLSEQSKSSERFAVRFAAKEALYKALTQALGEPPCPFFMLCAHSAIKNEAFPALSVDWEALKLKKLCALVTLSHTKKMAIAYVILKKI